MPGEPGIKLVSSAPSEVLPGQILNLSFLVVNNSLSEEEFLEKIDLPEGFLPLLQPGTISLGAGQSKPSLVSLRISREAPAGKHQVTYSVSSRSVPTRKASVTSTFAVATRAKLTMMTVEKPDNIIAGESFQVKVRILNEGNAAVNALLKTRDGKDFRVNVEPDEIALPPGSGTTVLMKVSTKIGERRAETLFLRLDAMDSRLSEKKVLESIAVGIERIPRANGTVVLKHRVPTWMTLRNHGDGTNGANQIEIAGSGDLDEAGKRRVDFLLRAPDQKTDSPFRLRDEFHFDFFTEDFSVRAGDESYGLSYLTNFYSFGRGIGLHFNESQPTRFGFFRLSSRWEDLHRTQEGAYAEHFLNDEIKVRVNHFRQGQSELFGEISPKRDVTSIELESAPNQRSSLKLECGQSTIASGSSLNAAAYRMQYLGDFGQKIRVTVDKIRADPDFAGSVRDMDQSIGTLEFPVLSWMQGRTSYSEYEQNLELNRGRGGAPRETLLQFGLNCQMGNGLDFSVDLDRLRRYDRFFPVRYDWSEKGYRAMLGKSWKRFDLRWEVRHSRRTNAVGAQETWNDSHSYFAAFRMSRKLFVSAYGGFSKNQGNRGSFLLRNYHNLGINSRWQPNERLSLNFWYLKYDYSSARNENSQGNLGIEYQLPKDALIAFNARNNNSWFTEKGPTYYELYYSFPLEIPLGRDTTIGNLSGRVVDAELPGKPPILNVALIMGGMAAVTDKNGTFHFPNMACGTYTLTIERKSVGLNRISSSKMPLEIRISGGKTTRIEIGMVKGAQLKGKFASTPDDQGVSETQGELVLTGEARQILRTSSPVGLGNILVELALDGETVRRVSENDGEFMFDALKPGTWHYKVLEENLPENHFVKNPEGDFTLGSGEIKEVSFAVLPRRRRIQIIDEGELKMNPSPGKALQ